MKREGIAYGPVIGYTALLIAASGALGWVVTGSWYPLAILLVPVIGIAAYRLIGLYSDSIRRVTFMFNAIDNDELKDAVLHDVVLLTLLGLKPVLSHGGGPGINKMLEKLNIPVQFINGLRYTSEDIMRVVEMVLVGQVNTELVGRINQIGGKAVGLSGVSGDIYHCHKRSEELGFVGDIDYVNADAINAMLDAGFIPVIAPVGTDGQGNTYNINGDTAAGKLASALGAEKLVILTALEGQCNDIKVRDVISYLNIQDVKALKDKGTIAGGMIPKVDCCVEAIEEGVTSVHIIDGRKPHSVLYEAFTTEGTGTTIGTAQPSVGIKW